MTRENTIRDRLWLWGHSAGSHTRSKEQWGLPGPSQITPAQAGESLGIRNLLMVRYEGAPKPPFRDVALPLATLARLVWSVEEQDGFDVDPVLDLVPSLPNLRGVILDDYFNWLSSQGSKMWLAHDDGTFPISLLLRFPESIAADRLELTQSGARSGNYRTREFAVDIPAESDSWACHATGALPDIPLASVNVNLPGTPFNRLRIRILSTHPACTVKSCGLTRVRFWQKGQELPTNTAEARSTSEYPGYPAANVLTDDKASSDGTGYLANLKRLRDRLDRERPPLDIWVVLYAHELDWESLLTPHLSLCDVITLWTWKASDLDNLETHFARLERMARKQRKVLGIYMWDYATKQPMPAEKMARQCTLGLRWLRERRIEGMIFLASCLCDLDLEAVAYTRRWIATHADEPLDFLSSQLKVTNS